MREMNVYRSLVMVGVALAFAGCPPVEDDATDAGMMMMSEADGSTSDQPDGFDEECACEGEEISCPAQCSEGLVCAAFRCTLGCIDDEECPDGYECLALSQNDFDNDDELNLGTRYCIEQ